MENTTKIEVVDIRQSREYAKYMKTIGWEVVEHVFIKKIGPVAVAKIQRVKLPIDWVKINKVLKDNRVVMCKLEPSNLDVGSRMYDLRKKGFRQDTWPLLATKTLRVDLRASETKIMSGFTKDCRYTLRNF